jgi:hypothetical protein
MATKSEVAAAVAFVFTAFGREPNEMHLEAWYMVLGQYPQAEIAAAARRVVESCQTLPPVGAVARAIRDARLSASKNMTNAVSHSMRITQAVVQFRKTHPHATADEVAEYVTRLENRIVSVPGNP